MAIKMTAMQKNGVSLFLLEIKLSNYLDIDFLCLSKYITSCRFFLSILCYNRWLW